MNPYPEINPYIWFKDDVMEAVEFYVDVFPDSRVLSATEVEDGDGNVATEVRFQLSGQNFYAMGGNTVWDLNPAVSFILNYDPSMMDNPKDKLKAMWETLLVGGIARMPLDKYGFSPLFGWVEDRFGVNWQLMLTDPKGERRPFITPAVMFMTGDVGDVKSARSLYARVFEKPVEGPVIPYGEGQPPFEPEDIMYSDMKLNNLWMAMMDGGDIHDFTLNGAISFIALCDTQAHVDRLWSELAAKPDGGECGWLTDSVGLSWQIVPTSLIRMMQEGNRQQKKAVTEAFMKEKKMDMVSHREAFGDYGDGFIEVQTKIPGPLKQVWQYWHEPVHIVNWCFASEDWHCPKAVNDLRVGGRLVIAMAAKDGSMAFDYEGTYELVHPLEKVILNLADGRKVVIDFVQAGDEVLVTERFEPDHEGDETLQREGWQSILDSFARYCADLS